MVSKSNKYMTEIMFGKKQTIDESDMNCIYLAEDEPDYIQVISPEKANELTRRNYYGNKNKG